ncbi:MAG TPA: AraC family transcriptional regulator [Candidatus Binatia bacterium]|nr:AraC family transcriptional regulator [Candidatus Binatia bacterium]
MRVLSYIPPPPLADFVELLWLYEGAAPAHARERLLPTGTTELVVPLGGDSWEPVISGPHSESFVIETAAQSAIMGVHFRPGGAFPFLDPPAWELHNTNVPLADVWGRAAVALHDRLREAKTVADRFRILEQALRARLVRPLMRHPAVTFALARFHNGARTVADVLDRIGLSQRSFIQRFTDEVGLTPKLFCRIQRFQQVIDLVQRGPHVQWANLAVACGYYDQAHFIHDFRAFSGFSPSDYLKARGEHRNHVPLAD